MTRTVTFRAWSIGESNSIAYPREIGEPATLAEAVRRAMPAQHKARFMVLVENAVTRTGTLHIYAVKQSSKTVRIPHEDGTWRVGKPLLPEALVSLEVRAFDPVEPWRWSPGADVVGVDRTLVEGRAA
jgi:hypothetical protein